MTTPIELGLLEVGLASLLVLVSGAVSILLRLGLEKRLLEGAVRTVVQLLLVGMVLHWVFALERWFLVMGLMLVMASIAGVAAVRRTSRRYPGIWLNSFLAMWLSSWTITAVALFVILKTEPWYAPRYAIPLLGMVLGNAMNGIALGLDRLGDELVSQRDRVEGLLALGATRWEAARAPIQTAVRTGMIPILNSMMIVGIVSLPGMMTGQLLAGASPVQATRYQIVIMFLLAAATALGTVTVALLSYRQLFNSRHQFLYERLR